MARRIGRGYSADFWKANVMNLLCMMGQAVFFLLPLFLEKNVGLTPWQIGLCDGSFWLVSVLSQPWLGRRLDRWGRRPFFIWGSGLMGLCSVAYVLLYFHWFPAWVPLIMAVRGLHGAGFSAFFTSTWTWVADQAPPQRLTEMLGVFGVSGLLAGASGPVLADHLYKSSQHFVSGFEVGLGLIVLGWLVSPLVHEHAYTVSPQAERRSISFLRLALALRMRGLTLACLAMGMTIGSLFTFVALYVDEQKLSGIGYLFFCYTLAAVVTRLFAGALSTRIGPSGTIPLALILQALALFAFSHLGRAGWAGLPLLLASGGGAGFAYGLIYPALSALAVERSGSQRGLGMSVVACFGDLGSCLGSAGGGVLATHFRYSWMFFTVGVLVTVAAVGFLVMEYHWRRRRRRRERGADEPPLRLIPRENRGR